MHYAYRRGYDVGRAEGIVEGKRDRVRQRKGKTGNSKPPGRPQMLSPLDLDLVKRVIQERPSGVTQVEAIKRFQRDFKQFLSDEAPQQDKLSIPMLGMKPESILASLRNRSCRKE